MSDNTDLNFSGIREVLQQGWVSCHENCLDFPSYVLSEDENTTENIIELISAGKTLCSEIKVRSLVGAQIRHPYPNVLLKGGKNETDK